MTICADMRQTPVKHAKTLNSWKEIASYLGRGVRTVQRWESELGLPVHRMGSSDRSPVFAFRAELDGWLRKQAGSQPHPPDVDSGSSKGAGLEIGSSLDRSVRLTSRALRLIEKQQAQTRLIAERIQKLSHLLPFAGKNS